MNKTGNNTNRFGVPSMLLAAMLLSPVAHATSNETPDSRFCQNPPAANDELNERLYKLQTEKQFDAISKRGFLRVLLLRQANGCSISSIEKELLEQFAANQSLSIKWLYVENEWDLLPELMADNGDIIAGQHNTFSPASDSKLDYTYTWSNSSYEIVQLADNGRINKINDLAGRQLAAYKNTPIWDSLAELTDNLPGFVLEEIPADMPYIDVMQRVANGEYDLALADSLFLKTYLPSHRELTSGFKLDDEKSMAWAVRAESTEFKNTLNQYLGRQHITHNVETVFFDDLSEIKERGILRVITSSNPSHYYLRNGKLYGFEYEYIKRFAEQHRLRVDVILAKDQAEMFRLLREGKGDIIAASIPSGLMHIDDDVQVTQPYSYANPVLIGREADGPIIDLRELEGRRITLPADSPYWDYLLKLQEQGAGFELLRADTGINMEGTLLMVALGMYDLTVIGNHQYKNHFSSDIGITSKFNLSEPMAHRWVVREGNPFLLRELDQFIDTTYRGEFYNILHARYFERSTLPRADDYSTSRIASLSPFDANIQKYANEYGFDWRLITALIFQESQFNPKAESDVGAEGLMQLIPATAELMGVNDTEHPETSINAGVRYLDYLRSKFEETLLLEDRMWFALASYNAGYGRVKYARKLAEEMGLDKNRWFDNVELAMLKMARPYKKDGEVKRRCRCGQTVVYVREIRTRYFNYIRLTETLQVASVSNHGRQNPQYTYN